MHQCRKTTVTMWGLKGTVRECKVRPSQFVRVGQNRRLFGSVVLNLEIFGRKLDCIVDDLCRNCQQIFETKKSVTVKREKMYLS